MKNIKIHYSVDVELLNRIDVYAAKNRFKVRSEAITYLVILALENLNILEQYDEIKNLNVKQLGYLKTIEDLNKILITALDIRDYKNPNSNPVIQQYFKNKKVENNE